MSSTAIEYGILLVLFGGFALQVIDTTPIMYVWEILMLGGLLIGTAGAASELSAFSNRQE